MVEKIVAEKHQNTIEETSPIKPPAQKNSL
jgi:hypothetical protein